MKFLQNHEAELQLEKCTLKAKGDARTATFTFALILTSAVAQALPKFLKLDYEHIKDVETATKEVKVSQDVELQTIDFYPVPGHKTAEFRMPGANLTDISISREVQEGNTNKVVMYFSVTASLEKHLWSWLFDSLGRPVYARFLETQGDMTDDLAKPPAETPSKTKKPN